MRSSERIVRRAAIPFAVLLLLACAARAQTARTPGDSTRVPDTYTRLEVEGAHAVDAATMQRTLGLPLPADSLYAGLRRLGAQYYGLGFVDATLEPVAAAPGTLRLRVDEGHAARLARVLVRGAEVIPEPEVRGLLDLGPGRIFRAADVESRLEALLEEYARRGYLDAEAALERLEFSDEGVVIGIALSEGHRATLAEVSVQGNTVSQSRLVRRLAGLAPPQPADARRIREAAQLLRRSGLFAEVDDPVLYRQGGGERIGVLLRVAELPRRNSVFGAVGVARDPRRDRAYLSGSVDLALRNIYGTGRDLDAAWKSDALVGSRLALGYHERYIFDLPLELQLDVAQSVRDSTYTWQSLGAGVLVPLKRTLGLELGTAVDRSVFHLEPEGNTLRLRHHVGLRFESLGREADGHAFGTFEVRAEYARRRDDLRVADVEDHDHVRQTLWSGRFEAGLPLGRRHVLAARGEWHVVDSNEPEVPQSELYEFGGARTLRGYREQQFRGDQVAFGGLEYRYGDPRAAQLYVFTDAGGLRLRRAGEPLQESVHAGYGLGLRADVGTGLFDLAFALGEERSFSAIKVHVAFLQRF